MSLVFLSDQLYSICYSLGFILDQNKVYRVNHLNPTNCAEFPGEFQLRAVMCQSRSSHVIRHPFLLCFSDRPRGCTAHFLMGGALTRTNGVDICTDGLINPSEPTGGSAPPTANNGSLTTK